MIWDIQVLQTFLHGQMVGETNGDLGGNSVGHTHNVAFGKGPNGSTRFFNGLIDDVRIYDRALSAAEVQALYNMGQ